jgi:dTMP kinase
LPNHPVEFLPTVLYNQNDRLAFGGGREIADQRPPRGVLITFEGIEGSGKTTQLGALETFLRQQGLPVRLTREPGGTPIGDAVRAILLSPDHAAMSAWTELFLYEACRAQHVHQVIGPALAAGEILLCDRFADATTAYQAFGRGLDRDRVDRFNRWATGGLRPDLTILLDCDVEVGLQRSWARLRRDGIEQESRFEMEQRDFHQRVRAGYLEIARREQDRVEVMDATTSAEALEAKIREVVRRLLERRGLLRETQRTTA